MAEFSVHFLLHEQRQASEAAVVILVSHEPKEYQLFTDVPTQLGKTVHLFTGSMFESCQT